MTTRISRVSAALALGWIATTAGAAAPATHEDVVAYIESAGFEVCNSVANDPPAGLAGARGKHLVSVARDCAKDDGGKPTVLFVFEFDASGNRDDAVSRFKAAHEPAITESGSAWAIGERFAIFASGPAHVLVQSALDAELARRSKAGE